MTLCFSCKLAELAAEDDIDEVKPNRWPVNGLWVSWFRARWVEVRERILPFDQSTFTWRSFCLAEGPFWPFSAPVAPYSEPVDLDQLCVLDQVMLFLNKDSNTLSQVFFYSQRFQPHSDIHPQSLTSKVTSVRNTSWRQLGPDTGGSCTGQSSINDALLSDIFLCQIRYS